MSSKGGKQRGEERQGEEADASCQNL